MNGNQSGTIGKYYLCSKPSCSEHHMILTAVMSICTQLANATVLFRLSLEELLPVCCKTWKIENQICMLLWWHIVPIFGTVAMPCDNISPSSNLWKSCLWTDFAKVT